MDIINKLNKIEQEARDFGFEWLNLEMVLDQIKSECDEVKSTIALSEGEERVEEEVGDLLHAVFSLCKFLDLDAAKLITKATDKFSTRFYKVKELANNEGKDTLKGESIDMLMDYWNRTKL